MRHIRKSLFILTLSSMIFAPQSRLKSYEYVTDTGGCGYTECCRAICIVPALGLAAVLLAGIIAVGVHNRSSSGHGHAHSDSD